MSKLKTQNHNLKIKSEKLRKLRNAKEKRQFIEKKLGISLENVGKFSFDEKTASKKNCENMIGTAQLPMGIAGPLTIKSNHQMIKTSKEHFVPLATTEGALVASVNRGCKAIKLSGGTQVCALKAGTTRGPVFYTGSLKKSREFYQWIKNNEANLAKETEETSNYAKLIKTGIKILGNIVYVRFYFDTKDAMGMNMATIATTKIVEYIEKETKVRCISIAGNFDIDKKASWLNFINNRGFEVWAEVILTKNIVAGVLKTTPEKFFDVWLNKCLIGSAISGSLGFNAHYANIITALFIATGQDPAHVVEGSLGITTTKVLPRGKLYICVYLPALMVGTVGGGTNLATQKEALKILGIAGGDNGKNAQNLAKIIAGAVLAGELSLLASLAERSLARVHQRLGR